MNSDETDLVVFSELLRERYPDNNVQTNANMYFRSKNPENVLNSYAIVENDPRVIAPLEVPTRFAMLQYLIVVFNRHFYVVHKASQEGDLYLWKLTTEHCQNHKHKFLIEFCKMAGAKSMRAKVDSYGSLHIPEHPPQVMILYTFQDKFARILDALTDSQAERGNTGRKKRKSGASDSNYQPGEEEGSDHEEDAVDRLEEDVACGGKAKRRGRAMCDKDAACSAVAVDPRLVPFDRLFQILGEEYCCGFVSYLTGMQCTGQAPEQSVEAAAVVKGHRRSAKTAKRGEDFARIVSEKKEDPKSAVECDVMKPDDAGHVLLTDLMTATQKIAVIAPPSKYVEVKDRGRGEGVRRRALFVEKRTSGRQRKPPARDVEHSGMMRVINEPLKPKAKYRVLVFNYAYGDIALGELGLIQKEGKNLKNPENWIVFTVVPDVLQEMFQSILAGYVNEKFAFDVPKLIVDGNMDREVLMQMYHKSSAEMHVELDKIFLRSVRVGNPEKPLHDRVKEHVEWVLGDRERYAEEIDKVAQEIKDLEDKAKLGSTAESGSIRGKIKKLEQRKVTLMQNKPRTSVDMQRGKLVGRAVFVAPFLLCRRPRDNSVILHDEGCPAERISERVQLALVYGLCKGRFGNTSNIAKLSNHPLSMLSAPICFMCGGGELRELPKSLLERAEYSLGRKEARGSQCAIKREEED